MPADGHGHERNGFPARNGHAARPGPPARLDGSKLPPQNLEAEASVLGSILIDNGVLDEITTFLATGDFFRGSHQEIYDAILALYRAGVHVDAVTLAEELNRRGRFEVIGGDVTLAGICEAAPSAVNAVYHAQIVKQKATGRELILAGNEIVERCYAGDKTAEELVELAERSVFAVADGSVKDRTVSAKTATSGAVERIMSRGTGMLGLGSGLKGLDGYTDGFLPEQMVILAARPSMGKTALALNFAESVAVKSGRGVLFVSLEMGETEIGERLVSQRSLVSNTRMRHWGSLRPDEHASVADALAVWETAPLTLDTAPERTTLNIMAGARRLKARGDLGLVIVDYLQLITPADDKGASRNEAVARISRELKRIARELKVPLIALSQLNRAVENREDRRPRMADLRESGAIEQDADVVLLLHRPDYYDREDKPGQAELIISKNRNGDTGTVELNFLKEIGRFTDLAPPAPTAGEGAAPF